MDQKRREQLSNHSQKMKISVGDFFSKRDQICIFLLIWSHLLRKSSTENFNFCAVNVLVCRLDFPQVKQNTILTIKNTEHELPLKFPNDFKT